jgi:hypothetical protein
MRGVMSRIYSWPDSSRGERLPVSPVPRQPASHRKPRRTGPGLLSHGYANGTPVQRRELRYGSREFLAASDLARRLPESSATSALIGSVARQPTMLRVLAAVWRLPVTDLRVQRADADAWWFGHWFGPRRRLAWAVLDLPAAEEHYLVGRPRQALRTNLRHARALGVTSSRCSYETWSEAVSAVMRARGDKRGPEQDRPGPGQRAAYYVARDARGTPLAFAGAALFGQFAALFSLVSRPDRQPDASWARYQLHTCLAVDLGCSGVEHLLTGSALREPAGNQYFQHLLGYRARNLRVKMIQSGEPEPPVTGSFPGSTQSSPTSAGRALPDPALRGR